jgi:hypothetical protein
MKIELMNDENHKIELVFEKGNVAQIQVEKYEDGFEYDIFFPISKNEAEQMIIGLTEYINSSKDQEVPEYEW